MPDNASNTTNRGSFQKANVLSFESRQESAMAQLIQKHDGTPFVSPSMQECPIGPEADGAMLQFAQRLLTGEIDTVIVMTGVGFRFLLEQLSGNFPKQQILDFLSDITTVARGPKPVAAMHQAGLSATHKVGHPHTWRDILDLMDRNGLVVNRNIGILEYGETNTSLIAGLEARGATVTPVTIYRWELPDDTEPLKQNIQRIIDGQADLVMFTSAQQVVHLLQVADADHNREALMDGLNKIVVASIGPTTSERLQQLDLPVHLEPEVGKMAKLVSAAADYWQKYGQQSRRPVQISVSSPIATQEPPLMFTTEDSANQTRLQRATYPLPNDLLNDREQTKTIANSFQSEVWYDGPFLRACRREATDVTPVWLMRQAGRYMSEYQEVRDKVSFLELCKNSKLCSEVMVTAVTKLGVDAAIIFSDLLPILEPMGLKLTFGKGHGPQIHNPVREATDVDRVSELFDMNELSFVPDTVQFTRQDLPEHIPVIGFAGSPFTLASYCIEGGGSRNYGNTKRIMYSHPEAWHQLMQRLTRTVIRYLNAQIRAGAGCVQLFDSWVGCLSPSAYGKFVLPHMKLLLAGLPDNVPVINFGTGNPLLLPQYAAAGPDVVGVDWRIDLDQAWDAIGHQYAVQGNLDPMVLLSDLESLKSETQSVLNHANGRAGHIFNLGHGIVPETPVDHAIALVDLVHELSDRR